MLLGDRPALLDPDPIARVKSQLTEQHARRTLGHSIGDAELILSADERIDALLVQLFDLMASRGE